MWLAFVIAVVIVVAIAVTLAIAAHSRRCTWSSSDRMCCPIVFRGYFHCRCATVCYLFEVVVGVGVIVVVIVSVSTNIIVFCLPHCCCCYCSKAIRRFDRLRYASQELAWTRSCPSRSRLNFLHLYPVCTFSARLHTYLASYLLRSQRFPFSHLPRAAFYLFYFDFDFLSFELYRFFHRLRFLLCQ